MDRLKVGTLTGTACDGGDKGVLQYGTGGGGCQRGRGSFLSGDGLRYGSRWDHVQQVLPLPVC